mgnify:CR=1 FL=1
MKRITTLFQKYFEDDISGLLLFLAKNLKVVMNGSSLELKAMDPRSRKCPFSMNDIVWAVVLSFVLNQESRNKANDLFKKKIVRKMVRKLFGIKLPHLDTCHDVMKELCPSRFRAVLYSIVRLLMSRKILDKEKFEGHFAFLLDGTGVHQITFKEEELLSKPLADLDTPVINNSLFPEKTVHEMPTSESIDKIAPTWSTGKKSKNGQLYFHRDLVVLRCIGSNGLSVIVDWEEINTEDGSTKEDCEHNAAIRLLSRFKTIFKRLKVAVVADALYANSTFFDLMEKFGFGYIFTFRQEKLKNVEKQIIKVKNQASEIGESFLLEQPSLEGFEKTVEVPGPCKDKPDLIQREYKWINGLGYAGHILNWFSFKEYIPVCNGNYCFAFLTNLKCSKDNIEQLVYTAKNRNRVEDGFNTLKNRGSSIKHKYSRKSDKAAKNYITLLMVAEAIKSLVFNADWTQRTYFKTCSKTSVLSLTQNLIVLLNNGIDKLEDMNKCIPTILTFSMPKID